LRDAYRHRRNSPLVAALLLTAAILGSLLTSACSAAPEPAELERLERNVEDILTLHTYEHRYRSIVYFGEKKRFLFLDTVDRQVLFGIDVVVQAGIDLAEGVEVRVGVRGDGGAGGAGDAPPSDPRGGRGGPESAGALYVTLPAATILLTDADEGSIREYFQTDRGGSVGWLEYSEEIENAKVKAREAAVADGILDQARENASVVVREFLELAGFDSVVVRFRPGREGING
jgi:hypothetical protein